MSEELEGDDLRRRLQEAGLDCEAELCGRLERFTELLLEWNAVHNLTGAADRAEVLENIVDSLIPLGFVERPGSLLDVGTGAGFPGLMLAAAWPETETVLCEPRKKRAAFLRFATLDLELGNVEVVRRRVEELDHAPFDLISSRAVSETSLLLHLTEKLTHERTRYLFYKGSRASEEAEGLPGTLESRVINRGKRNYLYILPRAV